MCRGAYSHDTNDAAFAAAITPGLLSEFAIIPKYGMMCWSAEAKQWVPDIDGSQKRLEAGIMKHLRRVFREWAPNTVDDVFTPCIVRHKALFGQAAFVTRVKAALLPAVQTRCRADFDAFEWTGKHIHYSNGITLHVDRDTPFEKQVQEGHPQHLNTKSTLRPFLAWDKDHPEAAALWKEILGELNELWKEDFYLKPSEPVDVAQAILSNSASSHQARDTARALNEKLDRLTSGEQPLSPLLKQLYTAWEEIDSNNSSLSHPQAP